MEEMDDSLIEAAMTLADKYGRFILTEASTRRRLIKHVEVLFKENHFTVEECRNLIAMIRSADVKDVRVAVMVIETKRKTGYGYWVQYD